MFMVENVLDMKYEGIISGLHAYIGGLLAKFLPFLSIHFSFAYPKCNPIFYWHHLSDFKQRNKVVLYSVLRNIKLWRMIACIWFPTLKTGVMKIIPFLENLHIITYIYLCVFIVFFVYIVLISITQYRNFTIYWYTVQLHFETKKKLRGNLGQHAAIITLYKNVIWKWFEIIA